MKLIEPKLVGLGEDTQPFVEEVAPGVYAIVQLDGSWGLSNSALIVGGRHSVLVDTFFTERRNRRLRELTDSLHDAPPSYVVNTHHHGDHVHGNGMFPEAILVSHTATRDAIAVLDPSVSARRFAEVDFGATSPRVPDLTYDTDVRLHLGGRTAHAFFPGLAHCPGNSIVHVPESGVLVAGDLLIKDCTPTFSGGSAMGFLDVLEGLRALDAEVVIPGHGPVCGPEVIDETQRYIEFVIELAREALKTNTSPLEASRAADLSAFPGWHDSERIVGNLYRAMSEVGDGGPFDVKQLWLDTAAFLGHPVRSRA